MQFITYQSLQNNPAALRKKMKNEGDLVVMVGGKPFALMIQLNEDEDIENILLMVSRMKAQMAVRAIRSEARKNGADKMTLRDINALIKKTRAERKQG